RQVILLHNRDHQTFVEIAQTLGRSPEAVRKLWVRAVDQLREALRPPDDARPSG
ncbi:MAG: RNA polymerase subunit sigma, partial [Planctomycetia bacterium]|nr:RNA polymerase subunit sigma [Planctomycetia bacterium]